MQSTKIFIREAEPADIVALTELMSELGYNTTPNEMKTRFENIQKHQDYKTFIATYETEILGMVGLSKNYSYEQNGIYVRVLALVTRSSFRQKGIGKKLMDAAENWARKIGADKVLLNCGNREERAIAQLFYKKIGYQIRSSGFVKKL
jgi:GNAT superfamily N-acetyltransferase